MLSRVASQPIIQHFFQFETFQKLSLLLLSSGRFSSLQTFLPEFSLHQKITYDYKGEGGNTKRLHWITKGGSIWFNPSIDKVSKKIQILLLRINSLS